MPESISDEDEEGHNDTSDGKQDDSKEDLPVTRKRKRYAIEGEEHDLLIPPGVTGKGRRQKRGLFYCYCWHSLVHLKGECVY